MFPLTWGTARPVALATGRLPFVSSCTLVPVSARNVPSRAKRALVPLLKVFALALAAITLGCAAVPPKSALPAGVHGPFEGYASKRYGSDDMWLCRPGLPGDPCLGDLTATELRPDGTRAVERHVAAAAPKVDCFYVYPTVDMRLLPSNHEDFTDHTAILRATMAQAARFGEACSLYVPLYRQVTIGTYLASAQTREERLEVAASDEVDAFAHYMGQYNHGRKIVLLGHSQGAEMIVRLLRRVFDHDAGMRERLLVAMPIGGHVEIPRGRTTGGTFATLPVCTGAGELGCVVAYQSFLADENPTAARDLPKPGNETVCVNPAAVDGGPTERLFSRTYLPSRNREGITTPFVLLRDFYAGRCVNGTGGLRFLGVSATPRPGDLRKSPLDLDSVWLRTPMGLHVLDFQFAQGDLIDMVARRAAALP